QPPATQPRRTALYARNPSVGFALGFFRILGRLLGADLVGFGLGFFRILGRHLGADLVGFGLGFFRILGRHLGADLVGFGLGFFRILGRHLGADLVGFGLGFLATSPPWSPGEPAQTTSNRHGWGVQPAGASISFHPSSPVFVEFST